MIKIVIILAIFVASAYGGCDRDRNVQFENPLYLNYGDGFFYIQGLTNGEAVVIYKHPDDARIFGQYTFKDDKCQYETVYYYVLRGKYEFTNPFISDETTFNITNKISFVKNGQGYEIEYNVHPRGIGIFQNLGQNAERKILPTATFKRTPARPAREIYPSFAGIGKQNLKVSYLRNGENFVQFIGHQNKFASIEGSYTLRTSDRRYHTIVYEIPLDDFDYVGMAVKEYEISTEENFFRSGVLQLFVNGTAMDVKFFVNKNGFHVSELLRSGVSQPVTQQQQRPTGVQRPFGPFNVVPQRGVQNPQQNFRQPQQQQQQNARFLTPTFSRPDQLTVPQPQSPQTGR